MGVCGCVHVSVYEYEYVHVCVCESMCERVYVSMYSFLYMSMCVSVWGWGCACVGLRQCVFVCVHICVRASVSLYCEHASVYMWVYVCHSSEHLIFFLLPPLNVISRATSHIKRSCCGILLYTE